MTEPDAGARAEEIETRTWYRIAGIAAFTLLAGSIPYLGCAFTFGIVSGLILLLIPFYVVLAQGAVVVIAVSLSLARRQYWLARIGGALAALAPASLFVAWYAREWWRCTQAPDPAAAFAYLNGSPLLPLAVVGYAALSLVVAAAVLFAVHQEAARARRATKPPSHG